MRVLVAAAAAACAMYIALRHRRRPVIMEPLPSTMAAVTARSGRCEVDAAFAMPSLGDGEVLIRVKATGINRLDCNQRAGKSPVPPGVTEVLGLEAAGIVVACSAGVDALAVGDEVMALVPGGGYAEFVVVHASTVMHKPPSLSWAVAASLPEAWLTAFKLVHTVGRVQQGDCVLIHAAASGVGVAAIQLVVAAGATALVTVGSAAKLEVCKRLGAAGGAVRHDGPWLPVIAQLAPGGKVSVVLDCVAGSYAASNLEVLGVDGRWVLYSLLSGSALPVDAQGNELGKTFLAALMKKRITLLATTLRTRPQSFKRELVERFTTEALPRIASGDFKHLVEREMHGLHQAQAAHDFMETNANVGKIVLHVQAQPKA